MITVKVSMKKTGCEYPINSIVVDGHAGSGPYGHDLACAAVSAILVGGINALGEGQKAYDIKVQEGHVSIINKYSSGEENKKLHVVLIQLKTIAKSYPNLIKIEENYEL